MQTALILMTILGCDDSATQCHYLELIDERWTTIAACNAVSEDRLAAFSNASYPVVVAICQTPEDNGLREVAGELAADPGVVAPGDDGNPDGAGDIAARDTTRDENVLLPPADIPDPSAGAVPAAGFATENQDAGLVTEPDDRAGIVRRILAQVGSKLPEAASVKSLVGKPVHVVTDSYSWVARRFEN